MYLATFAESITHSSDSRVQITKQFSFWYSFYNTLETTAKDNVNIDTSRMFTKEHTGIFADRKKSTFKNVNVNRKIIGYSAVFEKSNINDVHECCTVFKEQLCLI